MRFELQAFASRSLSVIGLAVALCAAGCKEDSGGTAPAAADPAAQAMPATDLYAEVAADEPAALRKYAAERVTLKGTIKGWWDLGGDGGRMIQLDADPADSDSNVTCQFSWKDDAELQKAKALQKGQSVVISGKVTGRWKSMESGKPNILMVEECKLLK